MKTRNFAGALGLTGLAVLMTAAAAGAAGGGSASATPADPRAEAVADYNRALEYRDRAWELEKELEDADEGKAAKIRKKMDKEFQKAVRSLRSAVRGNPAMYQAYSSLGYALRRLGEYEESLKAYDQALVLNPRYNEAVEYRAEAYLALGRLDEVKEAYMQLFREDPKRATELMDAMQVWVSSQGETAEEFASWVAERAELAGHTAEVSSGSTGGTW